MPKSVLVRKILRRSSRLKKRSETLILTYRTPLMRILDSLSRLQKLKPN